MLTSQAVRRPVACPIVAQARPLGYGARRAVRRPLTTVASLPAPPPVEPSEQGEGTKFEERQHAKEAASKGGNGGAGQEHKQSSESDAVLRDVEPEIADGEGQGYSMSDISEKTSSGGKGDK
ncbi:hypothetical protein N2152v2_001714 [Parachlorella kessleri]